MPEESQERLAFIEMLPADINVYIAMHMDFEEHRTLQALKRFTRKYVKVLQNLKRKPGVHLVDHGGDGGPVGEGSVAWDNVEGNADDSFEDRLAEIMNLEQFEPDDKAEICAFMKTRLQGGVQALPLAGRQAASQAQHRGLADSEQQVYPPGCRQGTRTTCVG